jgi:hypothetical protein
LSGLARGDDVFDLAAAIAELHPRHDTFPAEVFMRLAADALEVAGVGPDDPVPYPGLRGKYLGECTFQGRENRKIQFAILASASARGGIQPDLLDEVAWWRADDFWWYALAAAVAVIRACADRMGLSAPAFGQQLSARWKITPEAGRRARRALTRCRRCRRLAVFPSRDWQRAGACGAGR